MHKVQVDVRELQVGQAATGGRLDVLNNVSNAPPPYPPQTPGERLRKGFTVSMEIATG